MYRYMYAYLCVYIYKYMHVHALIMYLCIIIQGCFMIFNTRGGVFMRLFVYFAAITSLDVLAFQVNM